MTIPLVITNQGGASGGDYSGIPTSVAFASGETQQTFTFTAAADSVNDDGESVRLSLGTLPTGVTAGVSAETTVSIIDDDDPTVAVSFGQPGYTVDEGSSVRVTVALSGVPERFVIIPMSATNLGGAAGEDYSGVATSVVFGANETSKTFSFVATNDTVDDDGESVTLGFVTLPAGVTVGATAETTISIADDDDPAVAVEFGSATYAVDEGSSGTVMVSLSADPERRLTIPLVITNQGGASGGDYSGIPTSVAFASGETQQTFTFTAAADSFNDDGESVQMSLGTLPTGVTAGVSAETTVSIIDTTEIPWSTTLTVGSFQDSVPGMLGYSTYGAGIGSLSAEHITLDGTNYQVMVLLQHAGGLYLGTRHEMPVDFTLHIEELEFKASESSAPAIPAKGAYWWEIDEFQWNAGHTLAASITVPDGASSPAERPLAPPTARFSHLPESHDGTNAITFRIRFSEDFPMSFRTLRDEALEAINGRVTKTKRNTKGANRIWNITVRPDGTDDVEITLPATQDCADHGALCTEDGRKLYNSVTVTVPGP